MGICESSSNNPNNDSNKKNLEKKIDNILIENDTTGILKKYHYTTLDCDIIKQKNNGYLLPAALGKRDDINKYYNLNSKILGEGSFGQVCIGEKNGKTYAIKRIRKDKIKDIKSILLEAEISLQIKHENIIEYYEIFEDQNYISYVMDLGEGGDLFDFIVGCPLGHLPADIVIDLLTFYF